MILDRPLARPGREIWLYCKSWNTGGDKATLAVGGLGKKGIAGRVLRLGSSYGG